MNFLALAQKVHLMLRIGDETPGTQPSDVASQAGVLGEIVAWVRHAHDDICRASREWAFMRGTATFVLATGARTIDKAALATTVPGIDKPAPFTDTSGSFAGMKATGVSGAAEDCVMYVDYARWAGNYDRPPLSTGTPAHFTINPDGALEFDAFADRDYDIRLPYRKAVVTLTANTDAPMFDEDYHNTIVWWAILHYYCLSRDSTMELRQKAEVELRRELTKLRNEQLPDFTLT